MSPEKWTICIHLTSEGDYDDAQDMSTALEKLARKMGAKDPMIEILEQDDRRGS
jgi:hypothetical protein